MTENISHIPEDDDIVAVSTTGVPIHTHDPEDDVYRHSSPTPSEDKRLTNASPAFPEPTEAFVQLQNTTRLETRGVNIEHDVIRSPGVYVGEYYAPTPGQLLVGDKIESGLYAYRGYLDPATRTIRTEPITLNTSDGPDKPIHQGHSVILNPDPTEPTFVSTHPTPEYRKAKAERDRETARKNKRRAGLSN